MSILETGKLLVQAKAKLQHGEFENMVERDLPFSPRWARMLMVVAAHPRLSNRKHASVLPASAATLYELTKLEDEEWQQAEEEGLIRADVQRKDINAFRKRLKGEPEDPKPFKDTGVAEMQLMNYLDKFIRRWPRKEMESLSKILKQLATDILQTEEW